jgi:predicted amidohydrolase YtcJ
MKKGDLLAANGDTLTLDQEGVSAVEFLNNFVTKLDSAGFVVHMHAVGDGAVRSAIDAIEIAKKSNKNSSLPHTIAHMQVVHPDDQQRLGELGIYLAFTYGWAIPDYFYDLSVIPFVEELPNLEPETLYNEANYYIQATYPTKTAKNAGAVLIAGSDAPVDTREPVPFSHIATGMTRNNLVGDDVFALNANQTLSVHELIAAYTINGAKAMRQDDIVGSIEVGKRADLIILDRNIVELAESDDPAKVYDVSETQVLTTIFDGKRVYQAPMAQ